MSLCLTHLTVLQFSGHLESGYVAIIEMARNPAKYLAKRLNRAMKGMSRLLRYAMTLTCSQVPAPTTWCVHTHMPRPGSHLHALQDLIRLVVSRAEKDMVQVCAR